MKKMFLSLMVVSTLLLAACGQTPKKAAENTETEIEAFADEIVAATDSITEAVEEAAEAVEKVVEAAK